MPAQKTQKGKRTKSGEQSLVMRLPFRWYDILLFGSTRLEDSRTRPKGPRGRRAEGPLLYRILHPSQLQSFSGESSSSSSPHPRTNSRFLWSFHLPSRGNFHKVNSLTYWPSHAHLRLCRPLLMMSNSVFDPTSPEARTNENKSEAEVDTELHDIWGTKHWEASTSSTANWTSESEMGS